MSDEKTPAEAGIEASTQADAGHVAAPIVPVPAKGPTEVMRCASERKRAAFVALLDDTAFERVMVFTRSKRSVDRIAGFLSGIGITAHGIHANTSAESAKIALDAMREGKARVLVVTDVSAAGLETGPLTHVVHFEQPNTIEEYDGRLALVRTAEPPVGLVVLASIEEKDSVAAIEARLGTALAVRPLPAGTERVMRMLEGKTGRPKADQGSPRFERGARQIDKGRRNDRPISGRPEPWRAPRDGAPAADASGEERREWRPREDRAPREDRGRRDFGDRGGRGGDRGGYRGSRDGDRGGRFDRGDRPRWRDDRGERRSYDDRARPRDEPRAEAGEAAEKPADDAAAPVTERDGAGDRGGYRGSRDGGYGGDRGPPRERSAEGSGERRWERRDDRRDDRGGGERSSWRPRGDGDRGGGGYRGSREGGGYRGSRDGGRGGDRGGYRGSRDGGGYRGSREGGRDGGGYRGSRDGGGYRGSREGGRDGGGYRGSREGGGDRGGYRGSRDGGGYRGSRDGGGYRGSRDGGRGGDRGGYRGSSDRGDRPDRGPPRDRPARPRGDEGDGGGNE